MAAKVSIIVPVYNEEKNLERCMDSLLSQTLQDVEIILVDDGSSDKSSEMCDNFAGRDTRVHVIHKKNEGLGMARNSGMGVAVGEYIGFVDSDDYVLPDMFEKLYCAATAERAELALSGIRQVGGSLFSDDAEKEVCCFKKKELFCGEQGRQRLMQGIVGAEPEEVEDSRYNFAAWKNLYLRKTIEENSIRFPSERDIISEDVIFLLRFVSAIDRAVGIPGAYYCYQRNVSSLTRNYRGDQFEQFKKLVSTVDEELKERLPGVDSQRFVDRLFQARARVAIVSEVQHGREQNQPYRQVCGSIKRISGDRALQVVLRRYPYWKLPKKQAMFAFAMRYQLSGLLYVLIVLREVK